MSICCKAIRQIYYNAGSGYTVASYMTNEDLPEEVKKQKNGNYGIFQAFGTELPTNEGLDVELTGDWKPTKYGMQYSVSNFSVTMPTTKEGIRTYLSSSLIKGIGPAMAARIVETFGEDTLNVFNDSPEKLLQVKGITQKRLDDILEGYQKSSSIRELMMYLSPFGVTPAKASKIQEKFGPAAVMIVKEEPFRLCEVHGFGFLTVDQIAVKAKHFRADDPLRIKAAILHIMSEAEGEGHLYLKREDIIERVEKLLNHNKDVSPVSERAIRDTGNDMIHTDGSLVCHDGGFYTRKSFQAELGAAAAVCCHPYQRHAPRHVRPRAHAHPHRREEARVGRRLEHRDAGRELHQPHHPARGSGEVAHRHVLQAPPPRVPDHRRDQPSLARVV